MKFIKKNKAVIALYAVLVIGVLLISHKNKKYEKSISTNSEYVDIKK